MPRFRSRSPLQSCLCGLLLLALTTGGVQAGSEEIGLDCSSRNQEFSVAIPAGLRLDSGGHDALLLVEERGGDVVVQDDASPPRRWDFPPSGWAYQPAQLQAGSAAAQHWTLQPATVGVASAQVRLSLLCSGDKADLLQRLAEAGQLFAQSEDSSLPTSTRSAAREQSTVLLGQVLQPPQDATGPRLPWLEAQAAQARSYLYARMGRPAESRADLRTAEVTWQARGDILRSRIARHREAQQLRREGDLVNAHKALTQLQTDPAVRADATLLGIVTNDVCLSLRHLRRLREALECFGRAIAIHERNGNIVEAALGRTNRADVYLQLGRYAEADAEAQAGYLQAQHSQRPRAQLLSAVVAGNVARAQGRLDAALRTYLEALVFADQLQDVNLRANVQQHIGIAYLLLRDFGRAVDLLTAAASAYEKGGYWNNAAIALRNVADAQRQSGALASARASIARAQALVDSGRASAAAAEVQLFRAELALGDGGAGMDEAIASAQSAIGNAPPYPQKQRLTLLLARRSLTRGALPAADAWLRTATAAATRAGDTLGLVEISQLKAQWLLQRGDLADARDAYLLALQRALRVSALLSYPLHRSSYLSQARRSLEQALTLSQQLDADSAKERERRFGWSAALQQATLSAERTELAVGDDRRSGVLATVNEQVRRRWGIQSSEELSAGDATPLNIALTRAEQGYAAAARELTDIDAGAALLRRWQSRLQPEESLLATFQGERTAWSWHLQRSGISEQAMPAAPLSAAAESLLQALQDPASTSEHIDALAAQLSSAAGLGRLHSPQSGLHYLLADGVLGRLPPVFLFAADAASRAASGTAPPAVVRIGSLQHQSATTPACCQGQRLHIFADPSLQDWSPGAQAAASLPRLPGSRAEARAIAARWPSSQTQLWLGAEFTRSRALQALASRGDIVHFATHGFTSREEPGLDALLVVGDDRRSGLDVVSFHDLLGQHVRARLVVLGACEAGGSGARDDTGGAGLAHALALAGAYEVVAPLWRIDDGNSAAFMVALYDALARNRSAAAAVAEAQAQLALRSATAHPFHWSGFLVQRGSDF